MLVGGHGEVNPNVNWLQSRGLWIAYGLGILAFHIFLLSIPFLTVPVAWTLTNLSHNALHLIFLHTLKGTPWPSQDQGDCRRLTHWEQIDGGLQFTSTRKFLSVTPVILFFLTNLYTKYDPVHFYINFISLIVVLLPKLPQFHKLPADLFNGIQDKVNIKHGNLELWERCCMHYWEGEWHREQFNLPARYRGQLVDVCIECWERKTFDVCFVWMICFDGTGLSQLAGHLFLFNLITFFSLTLTGYENLF